MCASRSQYVFRLHRVRIVLLLQYDGMIRNRQRKGDAVVPLKKKSKEKAPKTKPTLQILSGSLEQGNS
jgi:hypothetical protein